MSRLNRISSTFSGEPKEAVMDKIAEIKDLMPFLINLTAHDRSNSRKMGSKSVDYVRQSLEAAKAFPDELKKTFDTPEMEKDYNLINNLLTVRIACAALLEMVDDTMMAAGIEAMGAADEVYASLKVAARGNANVKAMVDQISERFKSQGNRTVANAD